MEDIIKKISLSNFNDRNIIEYCPKCGSEKFYKIQKDILDEGTVSEYEIRCIECDSYVNYWYYGFYDNEITEDYLRMKKIKKRKNKIDRLCK